jgi:hypothetical protein
VDHLFHETLQPIHAGHAAEAFIRALRPTQSCYGKRRSGYCAAGLSRSGDKVLRPGSDEADWHCFPDLASKVHSVKRGSSRCRHPVHESQIELECPDDCSELGACTRGICSCPPGYWGLDCGLSVNAAGEPFAWKGKHFLDAFDTSDAQDMPGLYVYDVPSPWRVTMYHTRCVPASSCRRSHLQKLQ